MNVGFDVYRIRTLISEHGFVVNAGFSIDKRDRLTRKVRWQQLDEELSYSANQLDRDVVAKDQIRTIIQTFRDRRLFTETIPAEPRFRKRWSSPRMIATPMTSSKSCAKSLVRGTTSPRRSPAAPARPCVNKKMQDGREVEEEPGSTPEAGRPAFIISQQLQSAECRHRGHDRYRAPDPRPLERVSSCVSSAAALLRADERPGYSRHHIR